MAIAIEASVVDAMMPNAGTPLGDSCLNRAGNNPSLAAASGISAQIIVQPTSAPRPEMITAIDITSPAQLPPSITLAASENGAVEPASAFVERIPKTAVSDSM